LDIETHNCILGGGLAGLSTGLFLEGKTTIIEREAALGGLCKSIQKDGFTFDCVGGHILFSRNKDILKLIIDILEPNYETKYRNVKIYYRGKYLKYPFENGLSGLPLKENIECLYHYLFNDSKTPTNFKEWLYHIFGRGIAEKYLVPYNEKIWKTDLSKMDLQWVSRIPKPPTLDIIKSSIGISTEGYKHQLYFVYPKTGGIQSLIDSMKKKLPANVDTIKNFPVTKIYRQNNQWVVSDGKRKVKCNVLISTIPIFDLIGALDNVPGKIKNALNGLRYNSLITVLLGLNCKNQSNFLSVYFPNKHDIYHRICFMENFSKHNVPPRKSSLMAEITIRPEGGNKSDDKIINDVINDLDAKKIINKKDVCYGRVIRTKYAYVVYDEGYQKNITMLRDYINKLGIYLCGRFAEFKYLNMDGCIEHGLKLANKLNRI